MSQSPDASPFNTKAGCLLEQKHPHSFYCPISKQCMHDPVVLSDGHSYERQYIEKWLKEHSTSPRTGAQLESMSVIPNIALRNAIQEYFAEEFSKFRRAIQQTIAKGPQRFSNISSNKALLRTVQALMQCSILVNEDLTMEIVLQRIMNEARALLEAEAASVFLLDRERGELYSTVNSTGTELRISVSAGIAGHVASSGESAHIPDAYADHRFDKSVDARTGFRTRSILCVPIKTKKGAVLGVVQIINKIAAGEDAESNSDGEVQDEGKMCFTAGDQQLLQVFASQAATCLVNSGFVSDINTPKVSSSPQASVGFGNAAEDGGFCIDVEDGASGKGLGFEGDNLKQKQTSLGKNAPSPDSGTQKDKQVGTRLHDDEPCQDQLFDGACTSNSLLADVACTADFLRGHERVSLHSADNAVSDSNSHLKLSVNQLDDVTCMEKFESNREGANMRIDTTEDGICHSQPESIMTLHFLFASPLCHQQKLCVCFDQEVESSCTSSVRAGDLGVDFHTHDPGKVVNIRPLGRLATWNNMQDDEAKLVRPDDYLTSMRIAGHVAWVTRGRQPGEVFEELHSWAVAHRLRTGVELEKHLQVELFFCGMRCLERLGTEQELQVFESIGCHVTPRPATIESLRELVSSGTCTILNLALHCCTVGQSEYLLFEDGYGLAHFVHGRELQDLLITGQGQQQIRLVFLGACKSFSIGQHIIASGVQHVVCIRENGVVLDSSCRLFEKHFFLALGGGRNVREAFDCGVQVLKSYPDERTSKDASKFVLLPESHHHTEALFNGSIRKSLLDPQKQRLQRGGSGCLLPAQVEDFLGRNIAVHHALLLLTGGKAGRRCVVILGDAGVGKSSLMLEVGHFVRLRPSLFQQVHWLSGECLQGQKGVLQELRLQLESDSYRRVLLLFETSSLISLTAVRQLLGFPGVHIIFTASPRSHKLEQIQTEVADAGMKPVFLHLAPLDPLHQAHLFLRRVARALRNTDLEFHHEVDPLGKSPTENLLWRPRRPQDYLMLASSRLVRPHKGNLHHLLEAARSISRSRPPCRRHTVQLCLPTRAA